jgi:hypothetical protein
MNMTNHTLWGWLIVLFFGVNALPGRAAQQTNRAWEGTATLCGLSFTIVKNEWEVIPDKNASAPGECSGKLRHKAYEKLVHPDEPAHFYTVSIQVYSKTFEQLQDEYDVHREKDRWFVSPYDAPAYEIRGSDWWGIRADSIEFRAYARGGGGYIGASEAVWAMVSSTIGPRTAVLTAGSGAEEAFSLMLSTLRFDTVR